METMSFYERTESRFKMNVKLTGSLKEYLAGFHPCSCQRDHQTSLKEIEISHGAHQKLPKLLHNYGYHSVYLIADKNTMRAAGEEVYKILTSSGVSVTVCLFEEDSLVPDESALGHLLAELPEHTDVVIAVGTGTLNDLGKYISYKFRLPFYIIATAPSMDGFASNVSCLILKHMKTTLETHTPEAVIADLDVLAAAPQMMIAAGVGDILGKYIALLDWKLSSIITEEYHCDFVEAMVRRSLETVTNAVEHNYEREKNNQKADTPFYFDTETVQSIMEALVLSGIAMSYIGNSRPASGSEHHLSHFWELSFLRSGRPPVLHGIKVGIGTVAAARLYELLLTTVSALPTPDFDLAEKHIQNFSLPFWQTQMRQYYVEGAEEVLQLEAKVHKNGKKEVLARLDFLKKHWLEVQQCIEAYLPDVHGLICLLKKAGAPTEPVEECISSTLVHNSILFAKELRNRYGLLQLLFDLGLNEAFATQLAEFTATISDAPLEITSIEIIQRR